MITEYEGKGRVNQGEFKRGKAPQKSLPLPLIKGKGIKGIGLPNKK